MSGLFFVYFRSFQVISHNKTNKKLIIPMAFIKKFNFYLVTDFQFFSYYGLYIFNQKMGVHLLLSEIYFQT